MVGAAFPAGPALRQGTAPQDMYATMFHLWALNARVLSNKESYSVLKMGSDVALGAAHYSYAKLSWAEEIQAEHIGCELTERAHLFMHRHTAAVCHPPHTLSKSKCKLPRIMNEHQHKPPHKDPRYITGCTERREQAQGKR